MLFFSFVIVVAVHISVVEFVLYVAAWHASMQKSEIQLIFRYIPYIEASKAKERKGKNTQTHILYGFVFPLNSPRSSIALFALFGNNFQQKSNVFVCSVV